RYFLAFPTRRSSDLVNVAVVKEHIKRALAVQAHRFPRQCDFPLITLRVRRRDAHAGKATAFPRKQRHVMPAFEQSGADLVHHAPQAVPRRVRRRQNSVANERYSHAILTPSSRTSPIWRMAGSM